MYTRMYLDTFLLLIVYLIVWSLTPDSHYLIKHAKSIRKMQLVLTILIYLKKPNAINTNEVFRLH